MSDTTKRRAAAPPTLTRRRFVQAVALTGVTLGAGCGQNASQAAKSPDAPKPAAAPAAPKPAAPPPPPDHGIHGDPINVACIGAGLQGRGCLIENVLLKCQLPVRIKAVCDIWDYNRERTVKMLRGNGHAGVKGYGDYRDMLDAEKDVEAVIVATPDWMHAEHAIACLKAGKHVYCEKPMSNSLELARQMVLAARETHKLLQIGHQRYSNPRYLHAVNKLLREAKLLGRITHCYGQWNRSIHPDNLCPKLAELPAAMLEKYGYASPAQFLNWRHYKKYGGGPITDLGAHQLGTFGWFLGVNPTGVMASGGVDYYKEHEWYDNVLAILDYDTPDGVTRAFYQVLTTTGARGYYETFMGDNGTMQISEDPTKCMLFSEGHLTPTKSSDEHPWAKWVGKRYLVKAPKPPEPPPDERDPNAALLAAYKSPPPQPWLMAIPPEDNYHLPHLQNFFRAIRNGTPLNCPPEVAFVTTATVLKVNDAVAAGRRLVFAPGGFVV